MKVNELRQRFQGQTARPGLPVGLLFNGRFCRPCTDHELFPHHFPSSPVLPPASEGCPASGRGIPSEEG